MDKIMARGLTFTGCHGVLSQEKTEPQRFIVDLDMYLDLTRAGATDDLSQTVNYDQVFQQVETIVQTRSFNLIETLAAQIADTLLTRFPLQQVEVTVYKPDAPVKGKFDYFAVNIKRQRD